jgi:DNA-binding beta-propeller fold protein YncE
MTDEQTVIDLPPLPAATDNNGGGIGFGPDGKLYVGVGDSSGVQAQDLTSPFGKLLRINTDGSAPPDNPLTGSGQDRRIWAYGLHSAQSLAFQPGTGVLLINDSGSSNYQEINRGSAGANYGWPISDGPTSDPAYTTPLHALPTPMPVSTGLPLYTGRCQFTGGVFYNPATVTVPDFLGRYLFFDNCNGTVKPLDASTGIVSTFSTVDAFQEHVDSLYKAFYLPVDLAIGTEGEVYYTQDGGYLSVIESSSGPNHGERHAVTPSTGLSDGQTVQVSFDLLPPPVLTVFVAQCDTTFQLIEPELNSHCRRAINLPPYSDSVGGPALVRESFTTVDGTEVSCLTSACSIQIGSGTTPHFAIPISFGPAAVVPEAPLAIQLPAMAGLVIAGYLLLQRRTLAAA